jgi:glycosyltransferase involved in cell wall biosynthesis
MRVRALLYPRSESSRLRWSAPDDAIAVADEYPTYPAIARAARTVLIEHHMTRLDVLAHRRPAPGDLQRWRAETASLRRADLIVTTSARVAAEIRQRASVCPVAYLTQPRLPPVEAPVAAVLGDWGWPPNRWALDRLLRMWPAVRDLVPHARLLVAGSGSREIGSLPGVSGLGQVGSSADVLAECAMVPFPCPPSSGPKVKVLEALSFGRPVVSTPAGFEGIFAGPAVAAMTAELDGFAAHVASLLRAPQHAAELGDTARTAVTEHHSPSVAARCFADACETRFPLLVGR